MDEAIVAYIKRKYNLLIGERTAESIKKQIGNAYPTDEVSTMEIKGRDLVAGVPKTLVMNSDEIREALAEPINQIVEAVRSVLERTPPELAADIVDGHRAHGRRRAAEEPGRPAARGDRACRSWCATRPSARWCWAPARRWTSWPSCVKSPCSKRRECRDVR